MSDELENEFGEETAGLSRDEVLALRAKPRAQWFGRGVVVGVVETAPERHVPARLDALRATHRAMVAGNDPRLESPATRDLRAVMAVG